MYSMVITTDNTELYIWNPLKEEFKFSQQIKIINTWGDEYIVCMRFLSQCIHIQYSHITCFEYIARLVVNLTSEKLQKITP